MQDVIRAFDGGVERLLDHQVFAGADRRERGHEMQRRRRGDAHRIEAGLREQLGHVVRREADAVLGGELLRGGARAADHSHEPAAARGRDRARVEMRDGARADETETQCLCSLSAPRPEALARSSSRTSRPDGLIWLTGQPPSGLAPGLSAAEDSRNVRHRPVQVTDEILVEERPPLAASRLRSPRRCPWHPSFHIR